MTIINKEVRMHLTAWYRCHSYCLIIIQIQSPSVSAVMCVSSHASGIDVSTPYHFDTFWSVFQFTEDFIPMNRQISIAPLGRMWCPPHFTKEETETQEKCGDFPKITQQVNSRTELKLGLPLPNLVLPEAIRWHSSLFLVIVTASEVAKFPFCSSSPLMLSFKTKLGLTFRILKHRKVLSPMDVNQMCE